MAQWGVGCPPARLALWLRLGLCPVVFAALMLQSQPRLQAHIWGCFALWIPANLASLLLSLVRIFRLS